MAKTAFTDTRFKGRTQTIGATSVTLLIEDASGKALLCTGTSVPTGAGYAKGCLFVDTDVAAGTSGLYENIGDTATANFNAIGAITEGEIAIANGKILIGSASGVGAAQTVSGDLTISAAGVAAIASGVIIDADVKSDAAIAFSKLAALTSTYILVGNGTNVAVAVAMSGDATLSNAGVITVGALAITRAKSSAAAMRKTLQTVPATVATTGNTDCYTIVPETGTLDGVDFSGTDALAAHDTNYITYSITNLGQAGAGSTAMLAATDANTTKATGGTALVANGKRSLSLHGTPTNLDVVAGDRLLVRAAASGTLANTVTFPVYALRFGGTT